MRLLFDQLKVSSRHAFLEETLAEFLRSSLTAGSNSCSFTNDADGVRIINLWRFVKWTLRGRCNACHASLDATISILFHRVLTRRQGLDGGYDNFVHDIILTAECCCRDARQLLLIVQGLFATPIEDVTIRFCEMRRNQIIVKFTFRFFGEKRINYEHFPTQSFHNIERSSANAYLAKWLWLTGVQR